MIIQEGMDLRKLNLKERDDAINKIISSLEKKDVPWAYLAGWLDGDGSIHVSKKAKFQTSIQFSLTDEEPVRYIADLFNKGYIKNLVKTKVGSCYVYRVQMKGKLGVYFAKKVIPFLIEKREKAVALVHQLEPECKFLERPRQFDTLKFFNYLAGYFEAEGYFKCIYDKSRKTVYTELSISNTNLESLKYIQSGLTLNGIDSSIYTINTTIYKNCPSKKISYRLNIKKAFIIKMLTLILPIMTIKRKIDKAHSLLFCLANRLNEISYCKTNPALLTKREEFIANLKNSSR